MHSVHTASEEAVQGDDSTEPELQLVRQGWHGPGPLDVLNVPVGQARQTRSDEAVGGSFSYWQSSHSVTSLQRDRYWFGPYGGYSSAGSSASSTLGERNARSV